MSKSSQHPKFQKLRNQFPVFVYENYHIDYSEHGIEIRYDFNLSDTYRFHPTVFIPQKHFFLSGESIRDAMESLAFQLGLIELISYWKAACSRQVVIKPGMLTEEQVTWWKNCWFHGLGEFFYVNGIETNEMDFMEVVVKGTRREKPVTAPVVEGVIVPIGGGKDSVVSLELLRKTQAVTPMILNPRGASVHTIFAAGYAHSEMVGIHRTMDPLLLELNQQGFLNGHTPFSALLAFLSLMVSLITGKRLIALSNESSANEPTIPGTMINHQFSKSLAFETSFRKYVHQHVFPDVDYFSFLRPLNEIQIAGIFSRYPRFFPIFRSCNVGSKTDTWCGKCPKCLFTTILLAPFLEPEQLRFIFGKNLLQDASLIPVLDQLSGIAPEKPFECVGTVEEVNACLKEAIARYDNASLPALLDYYLTHHQPGEGEGPSFQTFLQRWDPGNYVPAQFVPILKTAIHG